MCEVHTGTYADLKRYDDALKLFEKDFRYRSEKNAKSQANIARWSMAKMMRMLGRVDEAHQFNQRLAAMGYRLREVTDLKR